MADRDRDNSTREARKRKVTWRPSSSLPDPKAEKGYRFRWVRTGSAGTSDAANVSARLREGYEPINASDYPEFKLIQDERSRFPDKVEVGGLLLCKIPEEIAEAREEYMAEKAAAQIASVDNHYMRESDGRSPLAKPQRTTKVKYGKDSLVDN
jgi:hypothetical protein